MNTKLFSTNNPKTNTINRAGGTAYKMEDKEAITQLTLTGTFNGTYYANDSDILKEYKELLPKIDPVYLAKLAVYGRREAFMKDMPSCIVAYLFSLKNSKNCTSYTYIVESIFPKVIDNGRMLRNFVQYIRSGIFGRKSFGTLGKRLINKYLMNRPDNLLLNDSVGNIPSLSDIIKMTHPIVTDNPQRASLFGYIIGGSSLANTEGSDLVQAVENFKREPREYPIPNVDFRVVQDALISHNQWAKAFEVGGWHFVRMNINTALRHGILADKDMVSLIANKLRSKEDIQKSKVFHYKL